MSGLSNYAANQLLECYFRRSAGITAPAQLWLELHVGNPGADGTANITTYSGYARVRVDNVANFLSGTAVVQSDSLGRKVINGVSVQFNAIAGAGQTFTHVTFKDASTGGNCIGIGDLTVGVACAIGDIPIISSSIITVLQRTHI